MQVLSTLGLSTRYVLGVSSICTAEAHAAKQKRLAHEQCKYVLTLQTDNAVFHLCGRSQWQWQIQRHRRYAVCVWQESKTGMLHQDVLAAPSWGFIA